MTCGHVSFLILNVGDFGCCPYMTDGHKSIGAVTSDRAWCLGADKAPTIPSGSLGLLALAQPGTRLPLMVPHGRTAFFIFGEASHCFPYGRLPPILTSSFVCLTVEIEPRIFCTVGQSFLTHPPHNAVELRPLKANNCTCGKALWPTPPFTCRG